MCSVASTYQKGSICKTRARRRVTVETYNQRKGFAPAFVNFPCAGRSSSSSSSLAGAVRSGVGERGKREIVIWSPQRPKAASIACFGHECSRSATTTWSLGIKPATFLRKILFTTCLSTFLIFCEQLRGRDRASEATATMPQGDPTSDMVGHLTLANPPVGKRDPSRETLCLCNPPSPTAVARLSHRLPIHGHRRRPNKIDGCGRVVAAATAPKPSEIGSCEPLRSAPRYKEGTYY